MVTKILLKGKLPILQYSQIVIVLNVESDTFYNYSLCNPLN